MRTLTLPASLLAVLCVLVPVAAQDKPAEGDRSQSRTVDEVPRPKWTLRRAACSRELWIGLPAGEAGSRKLLEQLRDAVDDTTSVAALSLENAGDASPQERAALESVLYRRAVQDLCRELGIAPEPQKRMTRVVLVGVLESCLTALRVAEAPGMPIDGVVLVDPPVADLPPLGDELPRCGVDVLLHPRSDAEFEREQAELVGRLGAWGGNARVMRGPVFDSLKERLRDAHSRLRGYQILGDGEEPLPLPELLKKLEGFDVIFVGELHGNPGSHRLQLEMLRHFAAQPRKLALATEHFERDTQQVLDAYLGGTMPEAEWMKKGRPWPNHADYRPLVELCREKKLPVLAGNIPRRLAARVNKEGPEVLEAFSAEDRAFAARALVAEPGAYKDKFFKFMNAEEGDETAERMYAAQCIKDDTMAESAADWLKANPGARVLHINGGFHSAAGLGVPEKLAALAPGLKIAMVTCISDGEESEAADNEWLVRVPAPRPERMAPMPAERPRRPH
ncbi:MAG: ChaN family lipoprotein [Planctomycetes bacterium]|nr:ChaN family lipoprotein [Planctomycetota bacterium]